MRTGAIDATVSFAEPIVLAPGTDRKAVARDCHAAVRRMIRGRADSAVIGLNVLTRAIFRVAKTAKGNGAACAAVVGAAAPGAFEVRN